jgi:hypothetical protein
MKDKKEVLRSFVKGKIAELLFTEMVRKDKKDDYVVIPFGYEYSIPELAKYKSEISSFKTRATLSRSPDFVLISNENGENCKKVCFIEVKYRKELNEFEILKRAKKIYTYWPETYLFLFTQNKIYFDSVKNIRKNLGKMEELGERIFSREYQELTLEVLKEFIR